MQTMSGHAESTIDILKVDIEYSEWSAIEAMLVDLSMIKVKQFILEFHTLEVPNINKVTTAAQFTQHWLLMRGLDALGFKNWQYYGNGIMPGYQRCCGMMNFINVNYIMKS